MDIVSLITENMELIIIGFVVCSVGFGILASIVGFFVRMTRLGRMGGNILSGSGIPGMGGDLSSLLTADEGLPAGAIGDLSQGMDAFGLGGSGMSIGGPGVNFGAVRRVRSTGGCMGNVIGGGVTGLIALVFLGISGFQAYTAISADSWPVAEGEIVASSVGSYRDSEGTTMFEANITYQYMVNDRIYNSERVRVGGDSSTNIRSVPQGMVDRYPVGTRVTVHYNPEDPSSALLETGVGAFGLITWIFLGLGGLMIFIALLVLLGGVFALLRGRAF